MTVDPQSPAAAASVFIDQSGRRALGVRVIAAIVALAALLLLGGFVASLVQRPKLARTSPPHTLLSSVIHRRGPVEQQLLRRISENKQDEAPRPLVNAQQIAGGYFAPWEEGGIGSFQAHAQDLTHIYPTWLELARDGQSVRSDDYDPHRNRATPVLERVALANGVHVAPVISNATEGQFDANRLRLMLASPANRQRTIDGLVDFVDSHDFAGVQVDFELLDDNLARELSSWMAELHRRLAAQGKELSVTLEVSLTDEQVRLLSANADYAVAMIYDEHGEQSAPGAISSATFLSDNLRRFTRLVPSNRLVLAVGIYGYDWRTGTNSAESVTNAEAMSLAEGYRDGEPASAVIDFDPAALEPTFQYMDENGRQHEVWFQDATSVANTMTIARRYNLRGAALWALGEEDPGSWAAFGRHAAASPDLHVIANNDRLTFTGNGELLRVMGTPHPGRRTYERDAASGLITDETYDSYPSAWNIRRSGAPDHVVALTFDDGPDPRWTPPILDILRRHHIHATFFMVGGMAATHPDLVRRVFDDGNEIGNHSFTHPNMAHVSEDQVRLELTATTRAIESIIGRTVTLFRPPFNADSEPGSYGEIMPMAVASSMNYVTAGESIDPEDWDITRVDDAGRTHILTSDQIVQSVLQDAAHGHAILLHDAGGDRSRTVAALEPIITELQARGYRFVTMGELEGHGRNVTMPLLSPEDRAIAFVDGLAFGTSRVLGTFLFWGFSIAIVLGLLRISLMISLAAGRRAFPSPLPEGEPIPRIDVMVAAFNEATVIVRTVQSILASRAVEVHVIVVDDGSTDGTSDIVTAEFGSEPRVTLLRKPNGGKASALNMALAAATAPVVVGVDADTQLSRTALAQLALWFQDAGVGAVAGNVKVGNIRGIVTRWQSIEYITSQNIDRRALARLNAITVVPGAIGAWRTEALRGVGGYSSDTLAEDMDLTWRIRRSGWRIANEPLALAYTEAPESLNGLLRQRFRWAFGTLQCLWKHRAAMFRHGAFGWLALPSLWLFQIAGQILAPLIDLQLLMALISRLAAWIASLQHADIADSPDPMIWVMVAIYAAFIVLELAAGWVAYGFDREKRGDLWLLPTQRLIYRQIMYLVVWRSLTRALQGLGHAWGKLNRSGQVRVAEAEA